MIPQIIGCCEPAPPTPVDIAVLNCDGTTTTATFSQAPMPVEIVQTKPLVICKSSVDFEVGCSSIDGRIVVRSYVQNDSGAITSQVFEQDGVTLVTDGSILVACSGKDIEDVEYCFQDISDPTITYKQVLFVDTTTNTVVATLWLSSLGSTIVAPTNIEACKENKISGTVGVNKGCNTLAIESYSDTFKSIIDQVLSVKDCNSEAILKALQAIKANTATSNTNEVLIVTALNSILSEVQVVNANTDTIEAKLQTLITDQLIGNLTLTQIKTALDSLLPELQAINANTDIVEALITATNTKLDTLIAEQDKELVSLVPIEGCVVGVKHFARAYKIYDSETATQISETVEYSADGLTGWSTTQPAGFTLGACALPVVCKKEIFATHDRVYVEAQIPTNIVGFDFDPTTYSCAGTDLSTVEFGDFQGCFGQAIPTTPIAASDAVAVNNHINTVILPLYNACSGQPPLVAGDIIYQYNADLTATVWYNNTVVLYPFNFVVGTLGANSLCQKIEPTIPTIHTFTGNIDYYCTNIQEIKEKDSCTGEETYRFVIEDLAGNLVDAISIIPNWDEKKIKTSCPVKAVAKITPAKTEQNHLFFNAGITIDLSVLIANSSLPSIHQVEITLASMDAVAELKRNINNGALGTTSNTIKPITMKFLDPLNQSDFGVTSSNWNGVKYNDNTLEVCSDFNLKVSSGTVSITWTAFKQ
jgi:hypothetical protein